MTAALEYAKAVFSLGEELGTTEDILRDLLTCSAVIAENPAYPSLIDSPALPVKQKIALIDDAFSGINENLLSLMKILCEKRAFHILPKLRESYEAIYNEAHGICNAEVVSTVALTDEQLSRIEEKLALSTGKKIVLKNTIDPSILGGLKLRYDGIQLDGSLRARLTAMEDRLKNTIL